MVGMKTVKRELAHIGMFGPDGTIVTKADLADCAETFDGKCPVSLGHKLADWMPKFGNVKSVALSAGGESLLGEVEMHDALAAAVDEKFYDDISVGIQTRKKDGKKYLHHLAFLGAIPPKIRDLKVFSDMPTLCFGADDVVSYHDKKDMADMSSTDQSAEAIRRIADKGRAGWILDDVLKALADLTSWCMEMVASGAKIPDALTKQMQQLSDTAARNKEDEVEDTKLKEENAQLKKDLADAKLAALASAKAGLVAAMEGKIPKGKQDLVLCLADALSDGEEIELSDADGKKEKASPIDILKRLVDSLPAAVREGRTDLDDEGSSSGAIDLSKIAHKF